MKEADLKEADLRENLASEGRKLSLEAASKLAASKSDAKTTPFVEARSQSRKKEVSEYRNRAHSLSNIHENDTVWARL